MPSYDVTFMEQRRITIRLPEGQTDAQRTELAIDHISWHTLQGNKSKILSLEPTPVIGIVPPEPKFEVGK